MTKSSRLSATSPRVATAGLRRLGITAEINLGSTVSLYMYNFSLAEAASLFVR